MPKGWSGHKKADGEFVEGLFHAHQVPSVKAKTSKEQLGYLQKWPLFYGPAKLFTETGEPVDSIKSIISVVEQNRLG
jgi:xylulose-5-phosphate/fructose-6-phosphate phosphoketolase